MLVRVGNRKSTRRLVSWGSASACLLLCFFLVGIGTSNAFTVEADVAKLVEKFSAEPHLENFSAYSTAEQEAVKRALADTTFLTKEYEGRTVAEVLSHYGIGSEIAGQVATEEAAIETGVSSVPDAGATAFLAGGEGLDAAATGLGVAGIGVGVGTAAAGAGAFVAGYWIGGKLMEVFGDENQSIVRSESTFSIGFPVEKEVWDRVHVTYSWCTANILELAVYNCGAPLEHETHAVGGPTYGSSQERAPMPPGYRAIGSTFYVLVFKSPICGGAYNWCSESSAWIDKSTEALSWPWADPITEEEPKGCESSPFEPYGKVAGWPPHLRKTSLLRGAGPLYLRCTPWEEVGCPFSCERVNKPQKYAIGDNVGIWRTPAQMPVNFPKPSRTCHEGYTCMHTEVPPLPSVEELVTKLPEAFSHSQHENLNHVIEHFTPGSSTLLPGTEIVPTCTSMLASACKTHIESYGFTNVEISPVTWEHAVLTKPANAVISLSPIGGSVVETSHKIEIIANPALMPLIIPTPNKGETGTQYKERLEHEGQHHVTLTTRTSLETNPAVGPEGVAGVSPGFGKPTDPTGETAIRVEQNPIGVAAPEEGGKIGPPSLPGFIIPEFKVKCEGFPFGVPCWLIETIESWSGTAVAPEWGIDSFTIMGHTIPGKKFNLSPLNPVMEKVRPAILIFCTIGIVLLFYRFAKGGTVESGGGIQDAGGTGAYANALEAQRVSDEMENW